MSEEPRAERNETKGQLVDVLAAELNLVLRSAESPLTLGELSTRLRRPFRAVAGVLAAGCRVGNVERLAGGRYAFRLQPALAELLAFVLTCEARWAPEHQLGLYGRAPGGETR